MNNFLSKLGQWLFEYSWYIVMFLMGFLLFGGDSSKDRINALEAKVSRIEQTVQYQDRLLRLMVDVGTAK